MASPMGPPMVPGFSLRVQLFASNAYGADDKPIRCFRVVTSPDATVREFCEEASRIHEINYGEPLAVKKCQDDHVFDISQSEMVGALFTSMSTIRVVQAGPANIRDSVPPDSALRYHPALSSTGRKRGRGSSARANGSQSPASASNKRQKLSDVHPDNPLPSCETDQVPSREGSNISSIPDSQQSVAHRKSSSKARNRAPAAAAPAWTKNGSHHVQRGSERGTSISAAAASPLSTDHDPPRRDRPILPNMSAPSSTAKAAKTNGRPRSQRSHDADAIESDSTTSSAVLTKTKIPREKKKSPMNGASTPGSRQNSRSSNRASPPELPLTPMSRISRKQKRQERMSLEATEKSRSASTDASEQRRREESEQRKYEAERAKAAELARQKQAEKERLAAEKLAAVNATAARIEKERLEKLKREAEAEKKRVAEEKRAERARLKKAKEEAAKLEKEKKRKQDEERVQKEKTKAAAEAEAERLRKEEDNQKRLVAAAEEARKSKEKEQAESQAMERKLSSASVESSGSTSNPSRKSALKTSQTRINWSPLPRNSPLPSDESSQAPASSDQRRVSFNLEATPMRRERAPGKLPTEVPLEKQSQSPIQPPQTIFAKNKVTTPIPPPNKSTSAIVPPASITPKATVKSNSAIVPPASVTPKVTVKGPSPTPGTAEKGAASRSTPKGILKTAKTKPAPTAVDEALLDDSDPKSHAPGGLNSAQTLKPSIRPNTLSPKMAAKPDPAPGSRIGGDQEEDVEMESGQSTPPDTRSPVVFNHNPPSLAAVPHLELSQPAGGAEDESREESDDSASSEEESDDSSESQKDDEDQDSEDESDGDEYKETADMGQVPRSSMELRETPSRLQSSPPIDKPRQSRKRPSPGLSDRESTTQDDIDQQLTSSIYEAHSSTPSRPTQPQNKRRRLSNEAEPERPRFKVGASLSALNAAKNVGVRRPVMHKPVIDERPRRPTLPEVSGSESESDSDLESESEDDEASSKAFAAQLSQAQSVPLPDSDSDSSSDDDSDEKYMESIRNTLKADLDRMTRSIPDVASSIPDVASSMSSPSQPNGAGKKSRIAGRDIVEEKRGNKYATGYTFSQAK